MAKHLLAQLAVLFLEFARQRRRQQPIGLAFVPAQRRRLKIWVVNWIDWRFVASAAGASTSSPPPRPPPSPLAPDFDRLEEEELRVTLRFAASSCCSARSSASIDPSGSQLLGSLFTAV